MDPRVPDGPAQESGAARKEGVPPTSDGGPDDAPHPDVWGFADSGFFVDTDGEVRFRGARYDISGHAFPDLVPWGSTVLGSELDPSSPAVSHYPPAVPERRADVPFEAALAARLRADQLSTDDAVRLRRGHGHTQAEMWAIKHDRLERVPDLVVFPERAEEVEAIVSIAREREAHVCLIPYGGGTSVTEALRCPNDERRSIVSVDLSRMCRVLWVDVENGQAQIEAGATGRALEAQLADHGVTIGHEPDSYELSTLGGWIATNAGGMKQNRYRGIADLVLGLEAVTADGVLRMRSAPPRESSGGDPARWLIGSEGRLGIVTSAIVKVFPLPEVKRYGSVLFRDLESGIAFVRDVQRSGQVPASVRLMDNMQFQFGQAVKPQKTGLAALRSRLEKLYVTRLRGFDPLHMVACTLLFEGSADEVAAQERATYARAARHRGLRGGAENGRRGYALTFAIAYVRDFLNTQYVMAESFETSAPWSVCSELMRRVRERIWKEHRRHGLPGTPYVGTRLSQLYDTGACIYIYFGFYYRGVENALEIFGEIERAAREEILACGGAISDHHGVGKLRKRFLPDVFSEAALELRQKLKGAIDPNNLFGCGN